MKPLKVMTVVGTRPEIIRLSCILRAMDASPAVEHVLVHTGQNYDWELNGIFFEDLHLRQPDYYLDAAGKNAVQTAGNILLKIDPVLEREHPDAFLILGDTNSCLSAIAAKKRHIPIFHFEAGNRCFDERVPEETNRKIVDHISDINLTYSSIARQYLLREGLLPDRVIKLGSPMREVLEESMPRIVASNVLQRLELTRNEYFVVSAHREENVADRKSFDALVNIINIVAEHYHLPVIVSTHPRTRNMIESCGTVFGPSVRLLRPMSLSDYNSLQINSRAVLSDSGTISEESSILNFRALNLRQAHERPEAMEEAAVMMTGLNLERVMQALAQLDDPNTTANNLSPVADYGATNVAAKMVRIIISYTDYIKRVVWNE